MREVFGCDFSGAKDPTTGIYYAKGVLEEKELYITQVVHCDDRLDLYDAIMSTNAPWGLDFPFAISHASYKVLGIRKWDQLLELAQGKGREEFQSFLHEIFPPSYEGKCIIRDGELVHESCRFTDSAVNSYSSLKRTNPNLRVMMYSGLKLLAYLRKRGVRVYPFDVRSETAARVYEVYPSRVWSACKLTRKQPLQQLIRALNRTGDLTVHVPEALWDVPPDAKDAVAACIAMAHAVHVYGIEGSWENQPICFSDREWRNRKQEGLIVPYS